jgi:hypothetical protein
MIARMIMAALMLCSLACACIGPATPAAAQGQPLIMAGPCGHHGYHPVCARSRKNTLVTYANACIARGEGSRVISHGACPTACPMIFKPVCAIDAGGKRKTFANDCIARAANVTVIRRGRCIPLVR